MYSFFKNWSDGERITLWLFDECWKIEIKWCDYHCMFSTGWNNFVKETDLCLGDTCIFECTGRRLEFNICIERNEDHDFIIVNPGIVCLSFLLYLCWLCNYKFIFYNNVCHLVLFLADLCGVKFFQIVFFQSLDQDKFVIFLILFFFLFVMFQFSIYNLAGGC